MERPLGELSACAVPIDGTPFKDRQMIVALGIGCDGQNGTRFARRSDRERDGSSRTVERSAGARLGFQHAGTVCFGTGKALHAAVRRHAGEAAFIQRCQVQEGARAVYHELMHLNPSAARSLEEVLEETLTVPVWEGCVGSVLACSSPSNNFVR
jgi:putative transposase